MFPFDDSRIGLILEIVTRTEKRVSILENRVWSLQQGNKTMAHTLSEVLAKVQAQEVVLDDVVGLVKGLRAQIAALPTLTPEMQSQIDAIFDEVSNDDPKLAAILNPPVEPVVALTPSTDPVVAVEPVVEPVVETPVDPTV